MGQLWWIMDKKEKKMQKKEAAVTLHNKDRPTRM